LLKASSAERAGDRRSPTGGMGMAGLMCKIIVPKSCHGYLPPCVWIFCHGYFLPCTWRP